MNNSNEPDFEPRVEFAQAGVKFERTNGCTPASKDYYRSYFLNKSFEVNIQNNFATLTDNSTNETIVLGKYTEAIDPENITIFNVAKFSNTSEFAGKKFDFYLFEEGSDLGLKIVGTFQGTSHVFYCLLGKQ